MTNLSATDGFDSAAIGSEIYERSIAELRADLDAGVLTVRRLIEACLERIDALDRRGPALRAVIEVNPDALEIADRLDAELAAGSSRGPLHGIPVLIKDNLDTADRMLTSAGSLALTSSRPAQDATVVARLRTAGAVILGKTNLSEWANFRSNHSSSGWSGRGGQTRNPYVLDRNPCGSSAGSAAAVAASLCAVAIGTETDGSIICPSSLCGVVGIKPTVGLTSRAGVIPISPTQDTVGPHGRSVADAVALLAAIAGPDLRDPATAQAHFPSDYATLFDPHALYGARIGVLRDAGVVGYNQHVDQAFANVLKQLAAAGAVLIDPVHISEGKNYLQGDEFTVLLYEFKHALEAYLQVRIAHPAHPDAAIPRTLSDLIAFNEAHQDQELAYFGQELFELAAAKGGLDMPEYREALERSRDGTRAVIDALFEEQRLDAIIAPSMQAAWTTDLLNGDRYAGGSSSAGARAGYPLITVPAAAAFGLPLGLTFIGRAYSEQTLIRLAYAFEQATNARRPPQYIPALVPAEIRRPRSDEPWWVPTRPCLATCRSDHLLKSARYSP
ncbi:MAG: amidase [Oscillochloris sp.]|nr:amidase [Oscillochloris sp.]